MKDLSPAARELIDAHRHSKSLNVADKARIKQKLMLRVSTMGATTAAAGTAAGMSLASKVVLVALGVTGVVGAGAVSAWTLRSRGPAPVTPAQVVVRPATEVDSVAPLPEPATRPMAAAVPPASSGSPRIAVAPAAVAASSVAVPPRPASRPTVAGGPRPVSLRPTTTPAVAGVTTSAPEHVEHPKAIDDRPVGTAPETPTSAVARIEAVDPEPELRVLREARDDLRAGRPANAYGRLDSFERHSPGGMLAQERSALAAIALCQAQPGRAAQARAGEFLRRSPESPLAARVKSACQPSGKESP